ncbi:MAG: trypsin-like peptidase domain-containing protein [Ignavibacteria bacterium]|nr:trypsin-like peptidase domain-containing protein [Ignavibacteria bacterium]
MRILILAVSFILLIFTSDLLYPQNEPEKNLTESAIPKPNGDDLTAEQIFEINKPYIVSIWYISGGYYSYYSYIPKDTVMLSGSGFIISPEGMVGTNNHVIQDIDSILIKTYDGSFHNAEVVLTDEKNDVAVLKILDSLETEYPVIKISSSDSVKAGQVVYAIGSPMGFEFTISEGIIAGVRYNEKVSFMDYTTYLTVEKTFDKVIQITAAISPGNSGGPLFNTKGEVIGVTTYSYGFYGNLNFAVSVSSLINLRKNLNYADLTNDVELRQKRQLDLFRRTYSLATNLKYRIYDYWFYSKQIDTMKTIDTFVVKQDSVNKVNFIKAENAYLKCMELQPDSFYVYRDLMDVYIYTDNFSKAENLYKTIRETFSSDSLLNTLSSSLAEAYSKSKDYRSAVMFYEKMLKTDTADMFIRYQIANTYEMMKNYDSAIIRYNSLIKRDPEYIRAYVQLGKIFYENKNDVKEAKKYLKKAFDKSINESTYGYYGSEYVDLFYLLGTIAVKEEKKTEALLYYLELKSIYTYTPEEFEKKNKLYKALLNMDD